MRIVAGEARGRRIITPAGTETRPTTDRVREAIFNSLHSAGLVEDRTFLDLFAGSGALGLEALSRGARRVVFIESSRRAARTISENLETLGLADRAIVRVADAFAALPGLEPVEVALLDPPYSFGQWPELLDALRTTVCPEAFVIESDRAIDIGADLRILKQRRYAGSVVTMAVGHRELRSETQGMRVLYPGSFDPVHNGHVELVTTAARLFDQVVVATVHNPAKAGFLALDERQALLRQVFAHLPNVTVTAHDGLVVDLVTNEAADLVIKGIRSGADLEIELQMAHTNRAVSGMETVLLPTTPETSFISSRFIREIAGRGGDVSSLVPALVAQRLATRQGESA